MNDRYINTKCTGTRGKSCGRIDQRVTQAQYDYSMKKYGRPICLICQRQEQLEQMMTREYCSLCRGTMSNGYCNGCNARARYL